MSGSFFTSDVFLTIAALWTLPWKGVALWKSAVKKQKVWFIILLVINTLGLLEIVYIFFGDRLNSLFKKTGAAGKKGPAAEQAGAAQEDRSSRT